MSIHCENKLTVDILALGKNAKQINKEIQLLDEKLNQMKSLVFGLSNELDTSSEQNLNMETEYICSQVEQFLSVAKQTSAEMDFTLNIYRENEQKTKEIIGAINI